MTYEDLEDGAADPWSEAKLLHFASITGFEVV
jgi:hypothetical protein